MDVLDLLRFWDLDHVAHHIVQRRALVQLVESAGQGGASRPPSVREVDPPPGLADQRVSAEEQRLVAFGSAAATEAEQVRQQVSELQAELSAEEQLRVAHCSVAAAEAQQFRQQVPELQTELSAEDQLREVVGPAAATEAEQFRQQVSELQAE
eukprot:4024722-Pyramimonas_sp.AAC.1